MEIGKYCYGLVCTKLPRTQIGYDGMWVIIDRLAKLSHFIPEWEQQPFQTSATIICFMEKRFGLTDLLSLLVCWSCQFLKSNTISNETVPCMLISEIFTLEMCSSVWKERQVKF